jgi:hypothetical protein
LRPAERLPELAVADDVDACLRLSANDIGDGLCQAAFVGLLVERLAGLLCAQELLQRLRADQAADVRSENAIRAAFHIGCRPDVASPESGVPARDLQQRSDPDESSDGGASISVQASISVL